MKVNLKRFKECKVKMAVEVEPETVENRFREVFRGIQKVAQLPGFREGKAPLELVEKKFFKEAHEEVLKSLIPDVYHQSVVKERVSPVSLPTITDIGMERGKKLTFTAEFEQTPEFSLKNYKGIKIKKAPVDVLAEDIEKGLEALRDSRAEFLPILEKRVVKHGDFVTADIESWQEGGQYAPSRKNTLLPVIPNEGDDFYQKVLGAGVNEVREVIVGGKPLYKVWIRGIQEKRLPELDESFAKGFGKDSVEALREAIRKDIAHHKQSESYESMKAELFEKLLALASFDLPESLVAKQKERLIEQAKRQQRKADPSLDAEAAFKARNQVKLYFILQKVAGAEGIDVDELELDQRINALAAESKRPVEEVRRVFEDDIREGMKEAKTVEFLLANAKCEEKQT